MASISKNPNAYAGLVIDPTIMGNVPQPTKAGY
jgi:hypothetical protein